MSLVRLTALDDGTPILVRPSHVVAVRLTRVDSPVALVITRKGTYSVAETIDSVAALMGGILVKMTSAADGTPIWLNPDLVSTIRLTRTAGEEPQTLVMTVKENYTLAESLDAAVASLSGRNSHVDLAALLVEQGDAAISFIKEAKRSQRLRL